MKCAWIVVSCIVISCSMLLGCVGQGPEEPNSPEGPVYTVYSDDEILEMIETQSPVVMYFYSTTCSSCLAAKPLINDLRKAYNLHVIYVSKQENQAIFDLYKVKHFPALYVYDKSELLISFQENDTLTRIYSQIQDGSICGMTRIDHVTDDDQHIIFSLEGLNREVLYYFMYNTKRICIFISTTDTLYVFSESQNCETNWLYLRRDFIIDGESGSRWSKRNLVAQGGECGDFIQIPYEVTASSVTINIEDVS